MPGPRQPTDLLILKGSKHYSKAELERRKNSEVKAKTDKIKAPDYLPPELKREFNKLAKELIDIEILTNLDVDCLASFLIARKLYVEASKELLENPNDRELAILQEKYYKQMRSSASDLGLTITSRCKLVVPKKEEKQGNKFAKFM